MIKIIRELLLLSVFSIILLHAFIPHTHTQASFQEANIFDKKENPQSLIGLLKLMFQDKSEDSLDNLAFTKNKVSKKSFPLQIIVAFEPLLFNDHIKNNPPTRPITRQNFDNNRLIAHSGGLRGPPLI